MTVIKMQCVLYRFTGCRQGFYDNIYKCVGPTSSALCVSDVPLLRISSTMISRLMLNLRNPRLASLSPMQADRSKQVFSTLVTFDPMHASESDSQSITYEEVRPTADARDPNIELTSECVLLRLQSVI